MKKDLYIFAALNIFTIIALVVGTWATTPAKFIYEPLNCKPEKDIINSGDYIRLHCEKAHEPLKDYPYNIYDYTLK